MTTITIQAREETVVLLERLAKSRQITPEALLQEALVNYLVIQTPTLKKYSFIGIGHSRTKNLSTQVEEKLKSAANRREGWSLPE